jgi:hypothetical protein
MTTVLKKAIREIKKNRKGKGKGKKKKVSVKMKRKEVKGTQENLKGEKETQANERIIEEKMET